MTERRSPAADADGLPLRDVIDLQGDVPPDEQDAVLTPAELEHERRPTRTELDHGAPFPDREVAGDAAAVLDGLDLDDLRPGETDDPQAATEEGLTYVPPIDPPVIADREAEGGVRIAAGTAVSAESDPYDEDHRATDLAGEPELDARIRTALRADARTAGLADQLEIATRGSVAVIRGTIADVDESYAVIDVASRVDGIRDVVDETDLAG